jgi:hypothetical protein
MVHHDRHGDVVILTAIAARHAPSFGNMVMDTSDGKGIRVVVDAANTSSAVTVTIHSDAGILMCMASTSVADSSR